MLVKVADYAFVDVTKTHVPESALLVERESANIVRIAAGAMKDWRRARGVDSGRTG